MERPCVYPLYSFMCISQPRAALKLTSQPCRACDWKRDGRGSENVASIVLEWNCPSPSWSALTSPLSAHKVADACHHTEFVPKLHLTNRQETGILTESAALPLLVYFWEVKVSGGLLHPVSSVLGNLLWCCSDFLSHVNRLRDRGAKIIKPKCLSAGWEGVVAFICRRRVWCARVDAIGSKRALCFQLSVWEVKPHLPRIPCHTLPHSPHRGSTRPHQTVHQRPNCRFHPFWHQNEKKKSPSLTCC